MARHCNECWETGHNKRTCPTLTERLLRYAKDEQENNEVPQYSGYWTKQYIKRTGLNPDGSKAAQGSKPKQTRQCGWCKNSYQVGDDGYRTGFDHNRRTCPWRKEWHVEQKVLAKEYRTEMLKRLKETGFGIGTLIKKTCWGYYPDPEGDGKSYQHLERILLVTGIRWDQTHQENKRSQVVVVQDVALPKEKEAIRLPLKVELDAETYEDRRERGVLNPEYEILSPSGSVATKPWGWENGESLSIQEPY